MKCIKMRPRKYNQICDGLDVLRHHLFERVMEKSALILTLSPLNKKSAEPNKKGTQESWAIENQAMCLKTDCFYCIT